MVSREPGYPGDERFSAAEGVYRPTDPPTRPDAGQDTFPSRPAAGAGADPRSAGSRGNPVRGSAGGPAGPGPRREPTGPAGGWSGGAGRRAGDRPIIDSPSGDFTDPIADTQAAVGQVVEQAQETVGQVVEQAKQQASAGLGNQLNQAAERLGAIAETFDSVGRQLRDRDQAWLATYTDGLTARTDHLAGYLREKDLNQLVSDAEHFARRQPALFLGGAVALGVLAARFLKSSAGSTSRGIGGPAANRGIRRGNSELWTPPTERSDSSRAADWPAASAGAAELTPPLVGSTGAAITPPGAAPRQAPIDPRSSGLTGPSAPPTGDRLVRPNAPLTGDPRPGESDGAPANGPRF